MNKKEQHISHKIKQLIEEKDFDSPAADWANMEALLEAQDDTKENDNYTAFFIFKIFIAMTTVFTIWYLVFSGYFFSPPPKATTTATTSTATRIKKSKESTATNETTLEINDESKTIQPTKTVYPVPATKPISQVLNQNKKTLPIDEKDVILKSEADSLFQKQLNEELAAYALTHHQEKLYLHLDRTFYKPGEAIWFNIYAQDAYTLVPNESTPSVQIEWINPQGKTLKKQNVQLKNGVAAADIQTNPEMAGGLYKIKAYTIEQLKKGEFFEREIQIQKAVLPHLRMELEFDRKAYGAGDTALAQLDLNTLADVPLANYDFSYTASLAGEKITTLTGTTNELGRAKVKVDLPKDLSTNDGFLNVLIHYQGQNESIARSIPIVLNQIDLQFFPEGGDMVVGLDSRVAFKALNEYGKAADIEGIVYNDKNEVVTTFKSYHQGMGAFDFKPKKEEFYHAKITKPEGISEKILLPNPIQKGYVLNVLKREKEQLEVAVSATQSGMVYLVGQAKGQVHFVQKIIASSKPQILNISTKDLPIGVTQLTLFDEFRVPQAERLVFVNADKQLNINIQTDKKKYLPREKVEMNIAVTDEHGQAVSGNFSLSVVDDKLLTFADDKQGHILSHFLLESDVKGKVEEPNFYFAPAEKYPDKDQQLALDYLLMTQGWRRFEWKDVLYNGEPFIVLEKVKSTNSNFISGKVTDAHTGGPMVGASLLIEGTDMGAYSDETGNFRITNLEAGTYTLGLSYLGFKDRTLTFSIEKNDGLTAEIGMSTQEHELNEVVITALGITRSRRSVGYAINKVEANKTRRQKRKDKKQKREENTGIDLDEIVVTAYKVPLIEQDNTTQGEKITSEQIKNLPTRNIDAIAAKAIGLSSADEEDQPSVRGSRSNTTDYYIDGIRVQGNLIPESEIEQREVVLGGTEAQFGNAEKALQGKVAGINITQATEKENKIRIRGSNSYQWQSQPLYVIDGVQLAHLPKGTFDKFLKPKDIKSINVLKKEAAQALYGEKAQAGVIVIKTKRPKKRNIKAYFKEIHQDIIADTNTKIAIYKNRSDAILIDLQSGRMSVQQIRNCRIELYQKEQEIRQLENLLKSIETSREQVVYLNDYSKTSNYLSEYERALSFKNGIYKPRQFYSPKYTTTDIPTTRNDFRSTIYWKPNVELDEDGKVQVSFYNSDATTTFKTTIEGVTTNGKIGRQTETYFTQLPVGMSTKLPAHILTGDQMNIPLTLSNHTDKSLKGRILLNMPIGFTLINAEELEVTLDANISRTIYLKYQIENTAKSGDIELVFQTKWRQDALSQYIKVSSKGFPIEEVKAGNSMEETFHINIQNLVEGSLQAKMRVYPSVINDLATGLDRMLRQPTGCFEQTSSKNYPNVLVLNYMNEANIQRPKIKQKALDLLDKGYQRLLTYEVEGGGFDWYGEAPAHEALTAYGLMQFVDMKAVYPVEQKLIDRTAKWLLSQRDDKGGWKGDSRTLHNWRQHTAIGDSYIAWAMTEAGYADKIPTELQVAYEAAINSQDNYLLALTANALLNAKDKKANKLINTLLQTQETDGSWTGATQSMTGSRGKALRVETTALTVLALLKKGSATAAVERGVRYIAAAKNAYGFGSTQSTVLAMKALVAYTESQQTERENGQVQVSVNGGKPFLFNYDKNFHQPIVFDKIAEQLTLGDNTVKVVFKKTEQPLPYDVSWAYSTTLPQSQAECQVSISTKLNQSKVKLGEQVRLSTVLKNTSQTALSNPIALVGIPSGLSVQAWQLKELQEQGQFDYYELTDDVVIFYYRGMAAGEERVIHLDLKADIPGRYAAPASSAYLYYDNEWRDWSGAVEVEIE